MAHAMTAAALPAGANAAVALVPSASGVLQRRGAQKDTWPLKLDVTVGGHFAAGETLEVTDRGRPVARLGPVPVDSWDQMIADGRIIPASDPDAFLDITPKHYPGPSASEVLAAMREDER